MHLCHNTNVCNTNVHFIISVYICVRFFARYLILVDSVALMFYLLCRNAFVGTAKSLQIKFLWLCQYIGYERHMTSCVMTSYISM